MPIYKKLFNFKQNEVILLFKSALFRYFINGMNVIIAPAKLSHGRLLIIIPATSAAAVERNRIKRQLKSIFYENKFYNCPYDVALRIKKEAVLTDFDQLRLIMDKIFQKLATHDK